MTVAELDDQVVFTEEPRQYRYRGVPYQSVTEHIKAVGFGPDFRYVNPVQLEYARQRGNAVDTALVYHYEGDLDLSTLDPAVVNYFNGALKFDRECPGAIVAVHPRLVHTELGVAGTPDLVRYIRGIRALVDWKTGVDNPLQTWMYMTMWNATYPNAPCYARYGLRLKPSGDYVLREHKDPDDGAAALAILQGDQKAIEKWRPKYGRGI